MKLAVLSDIHGNLPALEAVLEEIVAWAPDLVVVNGDVVSRGPSSGECLALLSATLPQARLLKGNHEEYVLASAGTPPPEGTPAFALTAFARWTARQLGDERLATLAGWPDHLDLTALEGGSLHVTHGSRLGSRVGIGAATRDEELPPRLGDPRDLFIVSHTHKPLLRRFGGTFIVNVGSVGTPLDDDVRAAYGQFTFLDGQWRAEVRRVAYDRTRAEHDFRHSGFLEHGGVFARMILAEFLHARGLAGSWMRDHHARVVAGDLELDASVRNHLIENGALDGCDWGPSAC